MDLVDMNAEISHKKYLIKVTISNTVPSYLSDLNCISE